MPKKILKSIFFLIMIVSAAVVSAQRVQIEQKRDADGISSWWYVLIFVMAITLATVIIEFFKRKKSEKADFAKSLGKRSYEQRELVSIDADSEIEWAKKRSKLQKKKSSRPIFQEKNLQPLPAVYEVPEIDAGSLLTEISENKKNEANTPLPIFEINRIALSRSFTPLPVSNDESLLDAIEQIADEFEEDEEIRALTLKILAAFKTQNSVEAIEQVALYDLSSNLRARAVSILAEFDHESVFETLLIACADPTREVRAAAAKGLFRLSFERNEAWLRIVESGDLGRIVQCARALSAGNLIERSLERLTHPDRNYAAEAFTIALLLIKAGETEEFFQILKNHPDPNIKKAILHVIKVAAEPKILDELYSIWEKWQFNEEIYDEIGQILEAAGTTIASS